MAKAARMLADGRASRLRYRLGIELNELDEQALEELAASRGESNVDVIRRGIRLLRSVERFQAKESRKGGKAELMIKVTKKSGLVDFISLLLLL